ncbi:hypothetical protein DSO57_1036007 [Entomophthora muscae]|uniref:Uncharacterized protein n=1 Tax=Entomophthora muscae TaxID=34485 RepID=A0ACC2RE85_9FUNG|nr:hypothetical protein DSO57_1036007 [Entomophthora muscae]
MKSAFFTSIALAAIGFNSALGACIPNSNLARRNYVTSSPPPETQVFSKGNINIPAAPEKPSPIPESTNAYEKLEDKKEDISSIGGSATPNVVNISPSEAALKGASATENTVASPDASKSTPAQETESTEPGDTPAGEALLSGSSAPEAASEASSGGKSYEAEAPSTETTPAEEVHSTPEAETPVTVDAAAPDTPAATESIGSEAPSRDIPSVPETKARAAEEEAAPEATADTGSSVSAAPFRETPSTPKTKAPAAEEAAAPEAPADTESIGSAAPEEEVSGGSNGYAQTAPPSTGKAY